jgi:hypothetical protein
MYSGYPIRSAISLRSKAALYFEATSANLAAMYSKRGIGVGALCGTIHVSGTFSPSRIIAT